MIIIGRGEVGRRLGTALEAAGWNVGFVTRERGWPRALDEGDASVRVLAVREEDLGTALRRFPAQLGRRLVLIQNGFLEAVYDDDLSRTTRGLIYFTAKGDFFRVLCASTFHGPLAEALGSALTRGGIATIAEPRRDEFIREMIAKGVWNTVVGLPLAVHEVDLALYTRDHVDELAALVREGAAAAGAEYGVDVDADRVMQKIAETTSELGWVRGGRKALAFRNGAIALFERRHGMATPVNDRLLRAVGLDPDRISAPDV